MHRLILRPLLVFLTLAMLVVALFQISGRLMFSLLDELELTANQWLSAQQIRLSGLTGDWRGLNPVLRIDRIDLPGGYIAGVYLEVDWLESLIRNRVVAQRLTVSDGYVMLEQTQEGWRMLGATGEANFDLTEFIYHSDQLVLASRIGFIAKDIDSASIAAELTVRYEASNRGGVHRHRLTIGNSPAQCKGNCTASFELDLAEKIWFVQEPVQSFKADVDNLVIPRALLGVSSLRIESLAAQWQRVGKESRGIGSIAFADVHLPDGAMLAGGASVATRGEQESHRAELVDVHVARGDERWELPPIWLNYSAGLVEFWLDRLELGVAGTFVGEALSMQMAAGRWLQALELDGEALNVRGYARLAPLQIGYAATIQDLNLNGYRGSPYIRGGAGEFMGHLRGAQMQLNARSMDTQFPETFHQRWLMDECQGLVQAWFRGKYFGLRGQNLRAEIDGTRVAGGFAVSRPPERYEQRLSVLINLDRTSVQRAKSYVPYKLPAGLPEWIDEGPRSGQLSDVKFAYHGQLHTRPFELGRRVELSARITDGQVRYHQDWPHLLELDGTVAVAGKTVRIEVDRGVMGESRIDGSVVVLGDNAAYADVDLVTTTTVPRALNFVRTTPLATWMEFITPDWTGGGELTLAGSMHIPLKLMGVGEHIGEVPGGEDELALDLTIGLNGVDLALPAYRVNLNKMTGELAYEYPFQLDGDDVAGEIFGYPAKFASRADVDTVTFTVIGQASYGDVLDLLDLQDPGGMVGGFDFDAELHIEMGTEEITRLEVVTDLTGLGLDLPGEYSKLPEESRPTELDLRFLDDYQAFSFRHGAATGWLHVAEVPLRGAVGFSSAPPMVDVSVNELVLAGRIERFSLDEVVPDGDEDVALPIPVRLVALQVGRIDVEELHFPDAILDGYIAPDELQITIASPMLNGTVALKGDDPLQLTLTDIVLPANPSEGDPLDVSLMAELPRADVQVDRFQVGDVNYGRWQFKLMPEVGGIRLAELTARVRDVDIASPTGVFWQAEPNRSYFEGTMTAGNLEEVLPLWGYAPSLATRKASLSAKFDWRGSPGNVDLERLVGQAEFSAEEGRFSDVETGSGAMRILSLVNFSTLAKRLNFDFSDVTGRGVSFDELSGVARFDEGTLTFIEPMEVNGSGSRIRIAGQVDLESGALDNEMIVTLPVNKSLPWYAAWVALANPLAGVGVLVGERVLRKPIEQFSSAKYAVGGTLDEPEVKFVGVWDTSINEPQTAEAPAAEDDDGETESPTDVSNES